MPKRHAPGHCLDHLIIPFIEGDGIGPDIWKASALVIDRSVEICWQGSLKPMWKEVLAGKNAYDLARLMDGAEEMPCYHFAELVCENMK
ncbi:MAG: hypothetical protein JW882_15825 [Deltaproteobacteria bacterium]|nr:hypothetical protein [Deltaproteobacteria bacterium]